MTLTFELDLDSVKLNEPACQITRSEVILLNIIVRSLADTHTPDYLDHLSIQ